MIVYGHFNPSIKSPKSLKTNSLFLISNFEEDAVYIAIDYVGIDFIRSY